MLLERRTVEDLEEVLQIRLDYLRERRGTTAQRREPTAGKSQSPAPVIEIEGRAKAQTAAEKAAAAKEAKKKPAASKKKK
jgi:hypothetical protein